MSDATSATSQAPSPAAPATLGPIDTFLADLGAAVIDMAIGARDMYSVFVQTLYYTVRGKREPGAVVHQMYEMGNKSVFFVTVVMGFIGLIGIYQTGIQAQRLIPDYSNLGADYLQMLIRELAPSVGALIITTRVGAGIAAEIGSMVVTEQVDALRMCAADPIDFLIKPRFVASIIVTTALIIWITTVMFSAGALTAWSFFGVPFRTFFDAHKVHGGDIFIGLTKCITYGATIPIVSGYCGLSTHGGSEGVGWATTRAVVNTSLTIVVLDLLISTVGFIVFFSK